MKYLPLITYSLVIAPLIPVSYWMIRHAIREENGIKDVRIMLAVFSTAVLIEALIWFVVRLDQLVGTGYLSCMVTNPSYGCMPKAVLAIAAWYMYWTWRRRR